MSKKNKVRKPDVNGNPLPEAIGKGINKIHLDKVLNEKNKIVGCFVTEQRKRLFKEACIKLGVKQSDVLNHVINDIINKAR